jgi:WD40 repeat protein
VTDLAVAGDGRTVFSLGDDNTLRRWDLARPGENRIVRRFETPPHHLACSPDGKVVAVTCEGWQTVVWDVMASRERFSLPLGKSVLAVSPDGKTLASCSGDGRVRLWDTAHGRQVHRFPALGDAPAALAFSPGGDRLAVACWQARCKVWDVTTGAEVHSRNDAPMFAVAFQPRGQFLATGHGDGSITLWDLARGRKQRTLKGHTGQVRSWKFTPDGKTLVSSAVDGTIRRWNGHRPVLFVVRLPRAEVEARGP